MSHRRPPPPPRLPPPPPRNAAMSRPLKKSLSESSSIGCMAPSVLSQGQSAEQRKGLLGSTTHGCQLNTNMADADDSIDSIMESVNDALAAKPPVENHVSMPQNCHNNLSPGSIAAIPRTEQERAMPRRERDNRCTPKQNCTTSLALFSPSQVPSNEECLHSIFSPSVGGITAMLQRPNEEPLVSETVLITESHNSHCTPTGVTGDLPAIPEGEEGSLLSSSAENSRHSHYANHSDQRSSQPRTTTKCAHEPYLQSHSNSQESRARSSNTSSFAGVAVHEDSSIKKENLPPPISGDGQGDVFGPKTPTFFDDGSTLTQAFYSPNSQSCNDDPIDQAQNNITSGPIISTCNNTILLPTRTSDSRTGRDQNENWHLDKTPNKLPIEMLNLEYVSSCDSARKLQSIVSALSCGNYPSLLKIASDRLSEVKSRSQANLPTVEKHGNRSKSKIDGSHQELSSLDHCEINGDSAEDSFVSALGTPQREEDISTNCRSRKHLQRATLSTTFRGLSASQLIPKSIHCDLQDTQPVDSASMGVGSPQTNPDDSCPATKMRATSVYESEPHLRPAENSSLTNATSGCNQGKDQRNRNEPICSSDFSTYSLVAAQLETILRGSHDIKPEVSEQLAAVTEKLQILDSRLRADQSAFSLKIEALQRAKRGAEEDVAMLEETVVHSSAKAREVTSQLAARQKELEKAKEDLWLETEGRQKALDEAKAERERLALQVENLSKKLAQQQEEVWKERELRRERDGRIEILTSSLNEARGDIKKFSEMNDSLSKSMKKLERNLLVSKERLKEERTKTREQKDRYNELVARTASAESAANAMAKALTISENELADALEAREKTEQKCSTWMEAKVQLELENKRLTQKIQEITNELTSSQVYIDNLYDQLHSPTEKQMDLAKFNKLQAEWKETERRHLNQIRKLECQIRTSETMVSLGLYQKAVKEARKNAEALKEHQIKVENLSSKLKMLEQPRQKQVGSSSQNHPLPLKALRTLRPSYRNKLFTPRLVSPADSTKNENESLPPAESKTSSISKHTPEDKTHRLSRAELSAKLRKARGRTKHNQSQPLRQRNVESLETNPQRLKNIHRQQNLNNQASRFKSAGDGKENSQIL